MRHFYVPLAVNLCVYFFMLHRFNFYTDPNHSLHSHHAPPKPIDNIRCTAGNILLTWSAINISHSGSVSEPIRVLLEASEHGGGYLVSDVKPVNSHQAPSNPLPILIHADNLSSEHANQWSVARSTQQATSHYKLGGSASGAAGGGGGWC